MKNEYNPGDFPKLVNMLENTPAVPPEERERVYRALMRKLGSGAGEQNSFYEKEIIMKRITAKKAFRIALVVVCAVALVTTAYATGFVQTIINRFQVGGMEIRQVDRYEDVPQIETSDESGSREAGPSADGRYDSLDAAQEATGVSFPVPERIIDGYSFVNCAVHGESSLLLELQYANPDTGDIYSMLISDGENGIQTTEEVIVKELEGVDVYYANGIVMWALGDVTYELYQMGGEDFSDDIISGIIASIN